MKVFEVKLKIFTLQNIKLEFVQSKIAAFIDKVLAKDEKLLEFHETNKFKNYCFDSLYPLEKDKVYKKDKIYTLTLRTVEKELAELFIGRMTNEFDSTIKALTAKIRILPEKNIEKIYSIAPMIIKNDSGYWKHEITVDEFEKRLVENLIKKYNNIMNTKIDEKFQLYTNIEFKNKKPIATRYKDIRLLGDKISLNIAENKIAQKLAYTSLGTGIGAINARGYGFVNYRWL